MDVGPAAARGGLRAALYPTLALPAGPPSDARGRAAPSSAAAARKAAARPSGWDRAQRGRARGAQADPGVVRRGRHVPERAVAGLVRRLPGPARGRRGRRGRAAGQRRRGVHPARRGRRVRLGAHPAPPAPCPLCALPSAPCPSVLNARQEPTRSTYRICRAPESQQATRES